MYRLTTMHSVIDGRTDRRQYDANRLRAVSLWSVRQTVVVDPAAAVCVNISYHVINVALGQVVAKILQYPPVKQPRAIKVTWLLQRSMTHTYVCTHVYLSYLFLNMFRI